jgi:hypothetical protein
MERAFMEVAIGDAPISNRIRPRGYSENVEVIGDPRLTAGANAPSSDRAAP